MIFKRLRTALVASLIVAVLLPTAEVFAATTLNGNGSFNVSTADVDDTQGGAYVNDGGFNGSSQNAAGALGQAAGQCAFNSMLSQMLSSFISYLLESLVSDLAEEEITGMMRVPIQTDMGTSGAQKAQRAKDVCAWAPFGFCVLPSLDAIAFCFVNQIIDYIGKATIEWIKTGFKGSPAFIDDPEKFFGNAIDSVAGQLLNQISDGLLCEPWRAQIQLKLLNEHVGSFQNSAQGCKLSEVSDKWEQFAESGDAFSWDLQYAYTQNPYNNPTGSYIEARNAFNLQLAQVQNGLQVQAGWSDGFLHVKDPETGRITTPGRVLESQINRRLGNAENRLLIADEFDEIINTLVNELIKLALSEMLGDGNSNDGSLVVTPGPVPGTTTPPVVTATTTTATTTTVASSELVASCVFTDKTILEGQTATATARVSGQVGTVKYVWSGDFTGAGAAASKRFLNEGSYQARLKVSDQDVDNEVVNASCTVKVSEDFKPVCTVDKTSIESGDRVLYTAEVTGNDGAVTDYDWGGDASGTGKSVSKRYTGSGSYSVHVEVADEEGNRRRVSCPVVTVD